jgi:GNAT superfamily N-acetyltransferase
MDSYVNIRRAMIVEASVLTDIAMRSKAFWGYSDDFMQACRNELQVSEEKIVDTRYLLFVAEEHGEILGYYALERLSSEAYELDAIFIDPRYIRKGIGKALINHAKEVMVEEAVTTLLIQGDPNAEGFYESIGAQRIGQRESASIPGRFLPLFRLSLTGNNCA